MFETSADILNIVKAISILIVALLSSWVLYYLARILRELFKIVKETSDRLQKIDEIIRSIKEKIEHSTSYLFLMSEGVKKIVEIIASHTKKKKSNDNRESELDKTNNEKNE